MAQEEHKDQHEQERKNESSGNSPLRWVYLVLGGLLLVALIYFGARYLINNARNKSSSNSATSTPTNLSADDIRRLFTQSSGTPPSALSTATPPTNVLGNSTSSPAYTPPPQAPPLHYQSDSYGFGINLPAGWKRDGANSGDNKIAFYNSANTAQWGYVEAYPNTQNTSLEEVEQTLRGSPSVITTSRTTLSGLPAVRYAGGTAGQSGLALVTPGYIYYLHGALAQSNLAGGFWLANSGYQNSNQNQSAPYSYPTPSSNYNY